MLANFGRGDEAMVLLEKLLARNPACGDAYTVLGGIYSSRGDLNRSRDCFEKALTYARSADEKSMANLKLGEIDLRQNNRSAAEARFQTALKANPRLAETVQGLRRSNSSLPAPLLKDR
jgi:tetratricopeptide (TPR) repeat protein